MAEARRPRRQLRRCRGRPCRIDPQPRSAHHRAGRGVHRHGAGVRAGTTRRHLAADLPRREGAAYRGRDARPHAASGAGWLRAVATERPERADHPAHRRPRPHRRRVRQLRRRLDGAWRDHVRQPWRRRAGRTGRNHDAAAGGAARGDARLRARCDHHAGDLVVSVGQARLWRDAVRPGARSARYCRVPGTAGAAGPVAPPR